MIRKTLLALVLAFSATPAFAANGWFQNPDCTNATATPQLRLGGALYYCADANSATAAFLTPVVRTASAGYFSVLRIGDSASTGAGACEFELYESASGPGVTPANVTGLSQIAPDSTGDNVQDAVSQNGGLNRRHLHGIRAVGVVIRVTVKAAGSEQCVAAFLAGN